MDQTPLPSSQKRFSLSTLVDSFEAAVKTFPVSSVYIALTSLWLIYCVVTPYSNIPERILMAFNFVLPLGCFLTTAITIQTRYAGLKPRTEIIAQCVATIILIADWIFIVASYGGTFRTSIMIGQGAALTAAAIGCLFVVRTKNTTYERALIFTNSQIKGLLITLGLSLTLAIANLFLFETLRVLFGLSIKNLLEIFIILCSMSGCSFIFLSLIPSPEQNAEYVVTFSASRFRRGLTKFMVLPAAGIYMIVLYIYGLKILFTWSLPNGFISWSVGSLSAVVMLALFELRTSAPFRSEEMSRKLSQWTSILMMPLQFMMTVAIWYRLAEYGATPSRLYVAIFNLWAIAAFGYLAFPKNIGKLNNVALSFGAIFLLTSLIPRFNLTDITYSMQRGYVKQAFAEVGVTNLPLDEEGFDKALSKMNPHKAKQVREKVLYLDDYNDHTLVSDIISFKALYTHTETYTYIVRNLIYESTDKFMTLPEGYSSFRYFYDSTYRTEVDPENPIVTFKTKDGISIPIEINRLRQLSESSVQPDTLIQTSDSGVVFRPMQINFTIYPDDDKTTVSVVNFRGALLKK